METSKIALPYLNDRCAIVIPTHTANFSELELYILNNNSKFLNQWDVYFVSPFKIDPTFNNYKTIHFDEKHFQSISCYSEWLKTPSLYSSFIKYKNILILQTDAILCKDELDRWIDLNIDYIGAPWHHSLILNNNFINSLPYGEIKLNVGNGGLSLRNNKSFINIIYKHETLIKSLPYNEDVVFSIIGLIDRSFKIGDYSDACRFALELHAQDTLNMTNEMPYGFHALYKYDYELWKRIFPDSPHIKI